MKEAIEDDKDEAEEEMEEQLEEETGGYDIGDTDELDVDLHEDLWLE